MALENGFHVLSDKPATFDLAEAKELAAHREKDRPALRPHAQLHRLSAGEGSARNGRQPASSARSAKSSWSIRRAGSPRASKPSGQKQAAWRTDPKRSGAAGCIGDIGTHAENLAEYITGLKISELAADLTAFVEGRKLDDDGNVLLRFEGGAKGVLHCSQISVGEENNLNIRVYGEKGGLEWHQKRAEHAAREMARPARCRSIAPPTATSAKPPLAAGRTPPAHPEGYLEAFANIYKNFANAIRARLDGKELAPDDPALDYPKIEDGVRGMAFIEAVVASSKANAAWTPLKELTLRGRRQIDPHAKVRASCRNLKFRADHGKSGASVEADRGTAGVAPDTGGACRPRGVETARDQRRAKALTANG